jgi:hypothetical protein
MDPREKLDAAHAKPPTVEDIDKAARCAFEVKREANQIRSARYDKMNPAPLSGSEAAIFAANVLELAYHAGWMARKLRNYLEEKAS